MGVTVEQTRFLSERLKTNTDKVAAERAGVKVETVYQWKTDKPDFKRLYDGLAEDGVKLCMEILRQGLGRAGEVITEGMDAKDHRNKPDHDVRINAAKVAMQAHGLLKNQQVHSGDPDHPVETVVRIEYADTDNKTDNS